ncbi:MFS transporter [Streptomyces bambusae]|uniref:MFS transporter n=1 Tax=Streptomyces bambusae TaxID=1550616 RepID=A0ABS6Z863_9ACTN|nr:MFS transporter [Streptomyces bambusae]
MTTAEQSAAATGRPAAITPAADAAPGAGIDTAPGPATGAAPAPAAGSGAGSGSGARARRPRGGAFAVLDAAKRHPVVTATAVAAVLHVVWFYCFANSGGDLAAQDAWAEFVGRHPDSAYNLAWYGGMHPVSYSVVSPYLMHVLGVRTTMMIAGTASAALLALILCRCRGAVREPLWPALAGVYGLFCNALSGRVTFGLGGMFALGAVAAAFCWPRVWAERRWAKAAVAAVLAGTATASSPVAGLFLGVVAAALFLSGRRPGAYALGLAPVAVVGLSALLFPFSGTQPMKFGSAWLPFVFALAIAFLVPKRWRTVRISAWVYALGVFLTWVIDSQIGSNATRMVMLFGGAVLLAALPYAVPRTRRWYALVLAVVGLNVWITTNSITDIVRTTPKAAWSFELAPLVNQLQKAGAERGRVEVVPVGSHRESSAFPSYVNLARGWNRQADLERNPLFYDDTLTEESYRTWLERWAVHYVVLPADKPDSGGEDEAKLVREGLPYLQQIWGDANWQLFKVHEPTQLVSGPATVVQAGADRWVIDVKQPGRVLVRIPHSPWLGLVDAEGRRVEAPQETAASKEQRLVPRQYLNTSGCLFKAAPDDAGDVWTELLAPAPGEYRIAAPYQLPRGTGCPPELVVEAVGPPPRPMKPSARLP